MNTGNMPGYGKGVRINSVGWQLTLCDPIWQVRDLSSALEVSHIMRYTNSIHTGEATRRHPLWHAAAACLWAASTFRGPCSQMQHSALYGNFKRKPWRPRPLYTNCWMDRRRLQCM